MEKVRSCTLIAYLVLKHIVGAQDSSLPLAVVSLLDLTHLTSTILVLRMAVLGTLEK
jgi:hypothetical protein